MLLRYLCLLCLSDQPSAVEKVDWFPECTTEIPDADELRDWMVTGPVKKKRHTEIYIHINNTRHKDNFCFLRLTEKTPD